VHLFHIHSFPLVCYSATGRTANMIFSWPRSKPLHHSSNPLFIRTTTVQKICRGNQNAFYVQKKSRILYRLVKEQRNILHEISKRKANWTGHILRRNCLLRRVIEGKIKGGIEVTERRGRGRRRLLDDLKERRWYSHLTEEALDRTMRRARFGRGFGPVEDRLLNEWIVPFMG